MTIERAFVSDDEGSAASKWFADLMRSAADVVGVKITDARIRGYAKLLNDLPPQALPAAFETAVRHGSGFFPTIPEIRRAFEGTLEDAALLAWAALMRGAAEAGAYATVSMDDGYAASALETVFGSWPAFCALEDGPAATQRRQEFLAAYRAARRTRQAGRTLPGLCEAGGRYAPDRSWSARLTAAGRVLALPSVSPRPALPGEVSAAVRRRLQAHKASLGKLAE